MRKVLVFVLGLLIAACGSKDLGERCTSEESCLDDPQCQCWCSQICNFRTKRDNDSPVYIEEDPNGKFCYCKQWDLDFYEENCIEGQHIPQPPGAN